MSSSGNDKTITLGGATSTAQGIPPVGHESGGLGNSLNCLPMNTRLGEFEIMGLIGEGGFGIVYLAYDHSLERKVALKEYMPTSLASRTQDFQVSVRSERHRETFEMGLRSFVNEARLLAKFDNPALVKVYRFWEDRGSAYMAMPFYDGVTLRDALRDGSIAPDENWIRRILIPLMDALEVMHSESCYHRDIAPDNILLLKDERPVLLDFGAARRVIGDMTQVLTVILKPGFAPIEQYAEMPGLKQGAWTDIYALAAVVYYIITGRTPPASVGRLMNDTYQPLASLAAGSYDPVFLRGLDQCLAVKADERPQSIAAMREALGFNNAPATSFPLESAPSSSTSPTGREEVSQVKATQTISASQPRKTEVFPRPSEAQGLAASDAAGPMKEPKGNRKLLLGSVLGVAAVAAVIWATVAPPQKGMDKAPGPAVMPEAATPERPKQAPAPQSPTQGATQTAPPEVPATLGWGQAVQAIQGMSSREVKADGIKSSLTVGKDALSFSLTSEHAGFVYLLLLDTTDGKLSLIFPNALDRDNRIAAGSPMSFPRDSWSFTADAPAGEWEVLVIVADNKRDYAGLGLQAHDGIASAPLKEVERTLARLGPGSLAGALDCKKAETRCAADFGARHFKVKEVESPPGKP